MKEMNNNDPSSTSDNASFEDYFGTQKLGSKLITKDQILQMPGSIVSKAYYVKSGLLRSYTIDDNGKVHIFMFAPEGWMVSDIESHALGLPTELFIDALEDSEIIEISQISIDTYLQFHKNNKQIIQKLFRRIAILQQRVMLLMSASAKQRYEHFLATYPQLVNRVQLKMIASYLGITPEALSNIRSKMRDLEK
jgi:CRP-like cAMP-binding protein